MGVKVNNYLGREQANFQDAHLIFICRMVKPCFLDFCQGDIHIKHS